MGPQARPLDAVFVPDPVGGQRLYLYHRPTDRMATRGAVLYVHPWADEMNKSRRMAAITSRALAGAGWAVLQVDLFGCGDSSGEFAETSWTIWLDDVRRAADWLRERHPNAPLWLWGLRAGALLATEAARSMDEGVHFLLWQPATQGKNVLQQFLRLKAAAQMADAGGAKAVLEAARADLSAGRIVQVAGYALPPAVARGLEESRLTAPPRPKPSAALRLVWLEVSTQEGASPGAQAAMDAWRAAGYTCQLATVPGPTFWQTAEIEDAPALVRATLDAMDGQPCSSASLLGSASP